ncbi:UNVERIFIED_CONTAM: hypothetical protein GTU68_003598 [Idotea baltica]|nr:hypothetical protein [Idotea baltica]
MQKMLVRHFSKSLINTQIKPKL